MSEMIVGLGKDREKLEAEITPEMIEAGIRAYREWEARNLYFEESASLRVEVEEMLHSVFRTMLARSS